MKTQTCDKRNLFGNQSCARSTGHLGLHRDTKNLRDATAQWGDNESRTQESEAFQFRPLHGTEEGRCVACDHQLPAPDTTPAGTEVLPSVLFGATPAGNYDYVGLCLSCLADLREPVMKALQRRSDEFRQRYGIITTPAPLDR